MKGNIEISIKKHTGNLFFLLHIIIRVGDVDVITSITWGCLSWSVTAQPYTVLALAHGSCPKAASSLKNKERSSSKHTVSWQNVAHQWHRAWWSPARDELLKGCTLIWKCRQQGMRGCWKEHKGVVDDTLGARKLPQRHGSVIYVFSNIKYSPIRGETFTGLLRQPIQPT